MDFKVSITCKDCGCTFELRGTHISAADSLNCPNCFHKFPQDVFENLKIGIVHLSHVPNKVSLDEGYSWINEGFELAVKEISDDIDSLLYSLKQPTSTEENVKD